MIEAIDRADSAMDIFHDEAGDTFIDNFRHRAAIEGNDRRTAGHRLDITRPNGSGQSIGTNSAMAPLRKSDFSLSPISPMNSTLADLIIGLICSS